MSWLTQDLVTSLASASECTVQHRTLASLFSTLQEPQVDWEPPGEEETAKPLKRFDNQPRRVLTPMSHHVGVFVETWDVLFGRGLRKGRRQWLPFSGVGGFRKQDRSRENKLQEGSWKRHTRQKLDSYR